MYAIIFELISNHTLLDERGFVIILTWSNLDLGSIAFLSPILTI